MDYRMKRYVKQFRMLNNVEIPLTKAGDMGHMWPKYGKNMG